MHEAGGGNGMRVMVTIENDGDVIPEELSPFLFVDRVSTSTRGNGGAGLSSARLLAKAHGGDVVLLSTSPVRFGIVLDIPSSPPLSKELEHVI